MGFAPLRSTLRIGLVLGTALLLTGTALSLPARADAASDLVTAQATVRNGIDLAATLEATTGSTVRSQFGLGGITVGSSDLQISPDGTVLASRGSVLSLDAASGFRGYYPVAALTGPYRNAFGKVLRHFGVKRKQWLVLGGAAVGFPGARLLTQGSPYRFARDLVDKAVAGRVDSATSVQLEIPYATFMTTILGGLYTPALVGNIPVTVGLDGAGRVVRVSYELIVGSPQSIEVIAYAAPNAVLPPPSLWVPVRRSSRIQAVLFAADQVRSAATSARRTLARDPDIATLRQIAAKLGRGKQRLKATVLGTRIVFSSSAAKVTWTDTVTLSGRKAVLGPLRLTLPPKKAAPAKKSAKKAVPDKKAAAA
ncbi:MAG: hypothetical protein EPO13_11575 [Actinomycetota bacterium]|nr:MAG: hypothetical protein EPO13_11575 [Actinomycetota bacterium]